MTPLADKSPAERYAPGTSMTTDDLRASVRERGHSIDASVRRDVPAPRSVMQEAHELVTGDRADVYGEDTLGMARRIAAGWGAILGYDVRPEHVGLLLAWLKIARQVNQNKRDNLVDLAGYAGVTERILSGLEAEQLDESPPSMHFDLSRLDDVEPRACPHCSLDLEDA